MTRSKWKGPYIDLNVLEKIKKKQAQQPLIVQRNSTIINSFVGYTFRIHNGKSYSEIIVNENMINHKFGEFSATRAKFVYVEKKKKRKSRK